MSDQNGGEDSGNRATIALVNAKVDTVLATVQGHKETTDANFAAVRSELKAVSSLSGRMDTLEHKQTALEAAVSHMQRGTAYRANVLPGVLIGVASLAVAIVAIIVAGGHP